MKIFKLASTLLVTILTILFLNGNIILPGMDLPPLGKLLDPVGGIWNNAEKDSQFANIIIKGNGISADIVVTYDERMVPHIFASNLRDAMFAQGYVEAQNRTFQLDFIKRLASGQLSEVLGMRTLGLDKQQRRKGLTYGAERAMDGWEKFPEQMDIVNAYTEGINTYLSTLEEEDKPIEHKLLNMPVREWSGLDCGLVFKWMSDVLCGRSSDIEYSNLNKILGDAMFDFLYPDVAHEVDPVIPDEVDYDFDTIYLQHQQREGDLSLIPFTPDITFPASPKGIGSNNWAVGPEKSVYGSPIFCNDPHLNLTLPSVWFEIGIHTPGFNAYGVTIPGMPGIMMGFNDSIAWGETNVGQDVKDFFHIKWVDKSKRQYEVDGELLFAEERIEEINIKGGDIVRDTVLYTIWGPVVYESSDGSKDYAMRWLSLDIPDRPEFMTFVKGMTSKNYNEYLSATDPFITPAQNFAFASKSGDIALRVNGIFPAKESGDGKFIEDGSLSANDWQAFIPKTQNPQVLNPARGFVASANQRSADNGYPYYYNGKFEYSRNRSINDLLRQDTVFSIDDMKGFQLNTQSKQAMDALPLMLEMLDDMETTEGEQQCLSLLRSWDYRYDRASETATLYEVWWQKFKDNTFDEISAYRDSFAIEYPEEWRLIEILDEFPDHVVFDIMDTGIKETAVILLEKTFREAAAFFMDEKEKGNSLEWGRFSPLNIYHLARIPTYSSLDMNVGGHPDALNAIGSTHGPSWRMVVSLKDETEAYGVFPGGQSGNPLSKFYLTSMDKWASGDYHKLDNPHSPDEVRNKLFTITFLQQ